MATRRSNRRWLLRDARRMAALFVWALIGFGFMAYLVDWSPLQRWVPAGSRWAKGAGTAQTDTTNDTKLYTGSILFVPRHGDLCTEWLLDNRNGNMWDNGQVRCRVVAAPNKPAEGMSTLRMQAIGKAFKE
jgi:hypothetical protein